MEKNHYVYMIVKKTMDNSYPILYIGCRTTNKEPKVDNYFGSSKLLNEDIKKLGRHNFNKIILKTFNTRKEALDYEIFLHNFYNVNKNKFFYNKTKQSSNKFDTTGTLFIKNLENETIMLTSKEYQSQNTYKYHSSEKVSAKDGKGKTFQCDISDPKYLIGEYVGVNKGTLNVKVLDGFKKIAINEFYKNYDKYIAQNKNKVIVKNLNGECFKVDKNDPRYLSGEYVSVHHGKILAKNEFGKVFYVAKEEFINKGMAGINKGLISGKNNPNAKVIKIFNDKNEIMHTCIGNFEEVCKNENLPFSLLKKTYLHNSFIEKPVRKHASDNRKKYCGWYARIIE